MQLITQRGAAKEYRDLQTGKEYFSISQIRNAMCNPFARANQRDLEEGRRRGDALHLRFALALAAKVGMCPYPDVIQAYPGHCRQMDTWVERTRFVPKKIEQPSVCDRDGFAGTPENLLLFPDGKLGIVDLKSGGRTPTDVVQLMLNQRLAGYEGAEILMDLYISGDGDPKPCEQERDPFAYAAAIAELQVMKWRLTL